MRDAPQIWARTIACFEGGRYWDAHEELEPLWLQAQGVDKAFAAGVILLSAALHKARAMGNARGGRRNYAKALRHLALVPDHFRGVDVRLLEATVHHALRHPQEQPRWPGDVPTPAGRAPEVEA
jgi:uncharacterized protein